MHASSFLAILATGASMVAAQVTSADEGTTTSTSTMTQTITITSCNPSVTNCPGRNTSTSAPVNSTTSTWYPISNTTVSAGPTTYPSNTTFWITPSSTPTQTEVHVQPQPTTVPTGGSNAPPTSGGANVFLHSGLLLGIVGAGVALLA